jgi:shikimate dehydrogenase
MKQYGLIGYPLGHSFSKAYFSEKFEKEGLKDCQYDLFPLEKIEDLKAILDKNPDLRGLNVTTPYKEAVIEYCDELDKTAEAIGAVNVLQIKKGKIKGFNTDAYGFETSLDNWLAALDRKLPSNSMVLGTGGAAKCVAHVLKKRGCEAYFVSRDQALRCFDYGDLDFFLKTNKGQALLVNATPVGTSPNVADKPNIMYKYLKNNTLVYDLVYNPEETAFLSAAKAQGCDIKNGLEMLHLQADKAWEIWNK